ncbi:PilZ domain-containing protein [Capillimicrobium parvum]|uniref:PilZ domain-containing protein n=1 Tax=Capillimicrobium parvum TaxID=2884022 RepID=A0A9E6Y2X0_9ACTN|nr:PilZ domain-containing protein [Capillimicrobium parvum]UGS38603.1 hypothetical protein DSM104329_05033 [Capillimicrobium parvum]
MVAAGAVMELSIVAAGVVVALGAIWLSRGRGGVGAPDRAPAPDPFEQPVVHHVGPDRRRLARAPVARPVVVRRGLDEQRTFALDVSPGGVLLAGPSDLTVGEVLDVRLDLGEPVGGRGRVVRETADGCKGVAFEELPEDDRDRLERYVRAGAGAAGQPG